VYSFRSFRTSQLPVLIYILL